MEHAGAVPIAPVCWRPRQTPPVPLGQWPVQFAAGRALLSKRRHTKLCRSAPARTKDPAAQCLSRFPLTQRSRQNARANDVLSCRLRRGCSIQPGSRVGEAFLDLAGREKIQTPVPICAHPGRHFRQMQSLVMGLEAEPHNQVGRNGDDFGSRRINEWQAHRRGSL